MKPSGVMTTPLPPTDRPATAATRARDAKVGDRRRDLLGDRDDGPRVRVERLLFADFLQGNERKIGHPVKLADTGRSTDGRGRDETRERGPDDRAEPAGQAERLRFGDARGVRGRAEGGGRPDIRAVVLTGEGRGFCVGQDLSELHDGERDVGGSCARAGTVTSSGSAGLEKPVLAAVNGAAAGAGLLAGVRVRPARRRRLGGLRPSPSSMWAWCPTRAARGSSRDSSGMPERSNGCARAGRSARRRRAWGLVSEVVAGRRGAPAGPGAGRSPRRSADAAIAMTKRLFERAASSQLEDQLELEAQLQVAANGTEDFAEGVAAFLGSGAALKARAALQRGGPGRRPAIA